MGKIGNYLARIGGALVFAVVPGLGETAAKADYFPDPTPSWQWVSLYSPDSPDLKVGDEIAVFAGDLLIGKFKVRTEGNHGFTYVYGDSDPDDGIKDGAYPDEILTLKIWDHTLMLEYHGITDPAEIRWTGDYDRIRVDVDKGDLVSQPCGGWDIDGDGDVDFGDFAVFADSWLDSCNKDNGWCNYADGGKEGSGEGARDGIVDWNDMGNFVNHWLDECTSGGYRVASSIF